VGQFGPPATPDEVGFVLELNNPLVTCVNAALAEIKATASTSTSLISGSTPARKSRSCSNHQRSPEPVSGVAPTTPPELLGSRSSRLLGRYRPGGGW
jgi:hypothetical protein